MQGRLRRQDRQIKKNYAFLMLMMNESEISENWTTYFFWIAGWLAGFFVSWLTSLMEHLQIDIPLKATSITNEITTSITIFCLRERKFGIMFFCLIKFQWMDMDNRKEEFL